MKFAKRFGICVITASLLNGCASGVPQRDPHYMTLEQLGMFVPNCKIRDQQMSMLLSQYTINRDELAFSMRGLSGEARRSNDVINRHLIYLREYCV